MRKTTCFGFFSIFSILVTIPINICCYLKKNKFHLYIYMFASISLDVLVYKIFDSFASLLVFSCCYFQNPSSFSNRVLIFIGNVRSRFEKEPFPIVHEKQFIKISVLISDCLCQFNVHLEILVIEKITIYIFQTKWLLHFYIIICHCKKVHKVYILFSL